MTRAGGTARKSVGGFTGRRSTLLRFRAALNRHPRHLRAADIYGSFTRDSASTRRPRVGWSVKREPGTTRVAFDARPNVDLQEKLYYWYLPSYVFVRMKTMDMDYSRSTTLSRTSYAQHDMLNLAFSSSTCLFQHLIVFCGEHCVSLTRKWFAMCLNHCEHFYWTETPLPHSTQTDSSHAYSGLYSMR